MPELDRHAALVKLCRLVAEATNVATAGYWLADLRRELIAQDPVQLTGDQWVVFYGGPDPDNCAGSLTCDDDADAHEWAQWFIHAGIAHRNLYAGRWVIDQQPREETEE